MMIAQKTEIIEQSMTFAEKFGWEALTIIVSIVFFGFMLWRIGGKIAGAGGGLIDAASEYIVCSMGQIKSQQENQSKMAEAISLLSASMAVTTSTTERLESHAANTHIKIDKVFNALLQAARLAYDSLPEGSDIAKEKLLRVIRDLEQ